MEEQDPLVLESDSTENEYRAPSVLEVSLLKFKLVGYSLVSIAWVIFWIFASQRYPNSAINGLFAIGFISLLVICTSYLDHIISINSPQWVKRKRSIADRISHMSSTIDKSFLSITTTISTLPTVILWPMACFGSLFILMIMLGEMMKALGMNLRPGGDFMFGVVAAVSTTFITGYLLRLCFIIIRYIVHLLTPIAATANQPYTTLFCGSLFLNAVTWVLAAGTGTTLMIGLSLGIFHALFFVCIGWLLYNLLKRKKLHLKELSICIAIATISLAINIYLYTWIAQGFAVPLLRPFIRETVPQLNVQDPSTPGKYQVNFLTYGSGKDLRVEYGANATIKTPTVNLSNYIVFEPWRRVFFGYNENTIPLNAMVWYPESTTKGEKFPLFVMVHGNHLVTTGYSEAGYEYLGQLLASRGYIAISIDENWVNLGGTYSVPRDGPFFTNSAFGQLSSGSLNSDMTVRSIIILYHLQQWQQWSNDTTNPFYGKVDMENIGLMGHSRGGEAIVIAKFLNDLKYMPENSKISLTQFDKFSIKSLVAIAPTNDNYEPAGRKLILNDINYFYIQGMYDTDAGNFNGLGKYDHILFTDPTTLHFKSTLLIHNANHDQFNTDWGRHDIPFLPLGWWANTDPIMEPNDQEKVAQIYISSFLDITLKNQTQFLPIFKDYNVISDILPDTIYFNMYEDSTAQTICNFDEDIDITTCTMPGTSVSVEGFNYWAEVNVERYQKTMLLLEWDETISSTGTYQVQLPNIPTLPNAVLSFTAAITLQNGNISSALVVKYMNGTISNMDILLNEYPTTETSKVLGVYLVGNELGDTLVMQHYQFPLAVANISNVEFIVTGDGSATFVIANIAIL